MSYYKSNSCQMQIEVVECNDSAMKCIHCDDGEMVRNNTDASASTMFSFKSIQESKGRLQATKWYNVQTASRFLVRLKIYYADIDQFLDAFANNHRRN